MSEELRVVDARMADWMANSSPPWATYCSLTAFHMVEVDKRPGVRPVGIGETFPRPLENIVMREAGDQAKTECGNLQLCAGLKAGIEGEKHAVENRQIEISRVRWRK